MAIDARTGFPAFNIVEVDSVVIELRAHTRALRRALDEAARYPGAGRVVDVDPQVVARLGRRANDPLKELRHVAPGRADLNVEGEVSAGIVIPANQLEVLSRIHHGFGHPVARSAADALQFLQSAQTALHSQHILARFTWTFGGQQIWSVAAD